MVAVEKRGGGHIQGALGNLNIQQKRTKGRDVPWRLRGAEQPELIEAERAKHPDFSLLFAHQSPPRARHCELSSAGSQVGQEPGDAGFRDQSLLQHRAEQGKAWEWMQVQTGPRLILHIPWEKEKEVELLLFYLYSLFRTARRSNQSILKEISPEYSLEGLMLKLKLQHFDHLM